MSTVGFAVGPAPLQDPLCNPKKSVSGAGVLMLPKGMEPRTLQDAKRRILQTRTPQHLIARVLRGMKSFRGWVSSS